jgi:hypothetical protein
VFQPLYSRDVPIISIHFAPVADVREVHGFGRDHLQPDSQANIFFEQTTGVGIDMLPPAGQSIDVRATLKAGKRTLSETWTMTLPGSTD